MVTPVRLVFVVVILPDLHADELRFHFKSGRLCLDFVATVGERRRRSFERLRSPEDLGRWLADARLLESSPEVTHAQLEGARGLREAIYRTAKLAGEEAPDPQDVEEMNRFGARSPLAPRLAPDAKSLTWNGDDPVEASLATIARDAIDLVSGPLASRVRECAAPDCALLFVDASRPGRRKWCSMEACGNVAKTGAYRRRKSANSRKEP